jgi:flagellar biosynthesis/type III secretory pathway protein FliH
MDVLQPSMVKQVFTREQFTQKKGLVFEPLTHIDLAETAPAEALAAVYTSEQDDLPHPAPDEASAVEPDKPTLTPEEIRELAFAEGLAQGLEQGQQRALQDQALSDQAQQAAQAEAQTRELLSHIDEKVTSLVEDSSQLKEPLKRLALHVAEQLVLGELTLSPQSVERLIDRCIDTLDTPDSTSLVVELNPNDLALLNGARSQNPTPTHWRLQADSLLLPGSVRVRADDAVVNDLIENRLESLAHGLLSDNAAWQAQSAFSPTRLASRLANQRGSAQTIEDAAMRSPTPPTGGSPEHSATTASTAQRFAPVQNDMTDEVAEPEDTEKHTYEAHELMETKAEKPSPMADHFNDTLNEISLELDKHHD